MLTIPYISISDFSVYFMSAQCFPMFSILHREIPHPYRLLELAVLFVLIPLLYIADWVSLPFMIPLGLLLIYALVLLRRDKSFDRKVLGWNTFKGWQPMLIRMGIFTIITTAAILIFFPEELFNIPRQEPWLILLIWVFYPISSVYPQELLFRPFFYHRYGAFFKDKRVLTLVNALLFGYMHLIFGNWIAVLGTFVASFIFSINYERNQSLLGVCIEHAFYGNWLFTVGFGAFFYEPQGM